ncbi:hypothetical protein ACH3XW_21575 [Acanthocheilonema viteae]
MHLVKKSIYGNANGKETAAPVLNTTVSLHWSICFIIVPLRFLRFHLINTSLNAKKIGEEEKECGREKNIRSGLTRSPIRRRGMMCQGFTTATVPQ